MGNVVAGEALRKLATPIVNTYIAMQAAVASQLTIQQRRRDHLFIWVSI